MAAVIASRFEVNTAKRLGDGGFGEVFRGRDRKEEGDVAAKRVKLADGTNRESFQVERDVLSLVHEHKSIIGLVDAHSTDAEGWLFLELADGGELLLRALAHGGVEVALHEVGAPL